MQLSPDIRKELRKAMSRRKKEPAVLAGSRSTTTGCGATAPQRSSAQLKGKRKVELETSGGSLEPVNWRPAPSDGSGPQPKRVEAVTGKHAASCSRQLMSPEGGDIRGCPGRVRRPASAKWAAQAHTHGFRPV